MSLGPWPDAPLQLSECECATLLSMLRGCNSEGGLDHRPASKALTQLGARVILHLRKLGWSNADLYVRDAGYTLAFRKEWRESMGADVERQVANFRVELDAGPESLFRGMAQ